MGLPLAEIARAVQDPASVRPLLAAHLRRLEAGLADARRELSRIHALLEPCPIAAGDRGTTALEGTPMTHATLPAAALAAALDAVRFAASADPELPMIAGVLAHVSADEVTLVTTDRFRMAVSRTPAVVGGPPIRVLIPLALADELRPLLTGDGDATLDLEAGRISVRAAGGEVTGVPVDAEFPDYERLAGDGGSGRRVPVDAVRLRAAVTAAPPVWRDHDGTTYPVVILKVGTNGGLALAAEAEWTADTDAHVAVNREFLLQALDAGGPGQLELGLDGPIRPLAVRTTAGDRQFSIIMPVRA